MNIFERAALARDLSGATAWRDRHFDQAACGKRNAAECGICSCEQYLSSNKQVRILPWSFVNVGNGGCGNER